VPEAQEVETWKPDPDTIRVSKGQESPAKRLRHEAEPLKRAKGVGDSPRLTHATHTTHAPHTPRPDHHKSSPNVASRHKTGTSFSLRSVSYSPISFFLFYRKINVKFI
jgi:hypothetical protein